MVRRTSWDELLPRLSKQNGNQQCTGRQQKQETRGPVELAREQHFSAWNVSHVPATDTRMERRRRVSMIRKGQGKQFVDDRGMSETAMVKVRALGDFCKNILYKCALIIKADTLCTTTALHRTLIEPFKKCKQDFHPYAIFANVSDFVHVGDIVKTYLVSNTSTSAWHFPISQHWRSASRNPPWHSLFHIHGA